MRLILFLPFLLFGCLTNQNGFKNLVHREFPNNREKNNGIHRLTRGGRTLPTGTELAAYVSNPGPETHCLELNQVENPSPVPAILTEAQRAPAEKALTPVKTGAVGDGCQYFDQFLATGISKKALQQALFYHSQNKARFTKPYLSIADYSQNSDQDRFYIFDLSTGEIVKQTRVSHGHGGPGHNEGKVNGRLKISKCYHGNNLNNRTGLSRGGFFKVAELYQSQGSWPEIRNEGNNNAVRMDGLTEGVNEEARLNGVVMHGANYNTFSGAMGRSEGCPAFSPPEQSEILPLLKDGTLHYSYLPETNDAPTCQKLQKKVDDSIPGWETMCQSPAANSVSL